MQAVSALANKICCSETAQNYNFFNKTTALIQSKSPNKRLILSFYPGIILRANY
jgi:hypothetical protein